MRKFTKEKTNLCKGIAICIMMFHHLFYNPNSWSMYYYKFHINTKPMISFIATQGKVCVAIFVLLSSYGLFFSKEIDLKNKSIRNYLKFVWIHIINLYKLYWPVFILAMMFGFITDVSNPINVYRSFEEGLRDFFGIAYIFDGETPFNGAWWYISFAITLYLFFPILIILMDRYPKLLLVISFLIGIKPVSNIPIILEWRRYMFVCCLGIYLAKNNILNIMLNTKNKIVSIVVSFFMSILLFLVRSFYPFTFDGFFAISIILFSVLLFESFDYFKRMLILFGKYSGTMFLLHGLLYENFARTFIYGFKYPALIFTVLFVCSFFISLVIESIKYKMYTSINIVSMHK